MLFMIIGTVMFSIFSTQKPVISRIWLYKYNGLNNRPYEAPKYLKLKLYQLKYPKSIIIVFYRKMKYDFTYQKCKIFVKKCEKSFAYCV